MTGGPSDGSEIGVDPHKGSRTATMLDRAERELTRIRVRAGRRQVEQLLESANGYTARTWAVGALADSLLHVQLHAVPPRPQQAVDRRSLRAFRSRVPLGPALPWVPQRSVQLAAAR
jgi:hypothetical protein